MRIRSTMRRIGREWLVALSAYALVVAPFGCQFQSDLLNGPSGSDDPPVAGLFVNENLDDALMAAGRNEQGDTFFVYGTRLSNGLIGEVDSILVRTAAGDESFIIFSQGRPVWLQGTDGSYVRIAYDEVAVNRLAATVTVYDAGTGQSQTTAVDIDLLKTANEMAQAIGALTGVSVVVPEASAAGTAKWQHRAIGPLLAGFIVGVLIGASQLLIVIMGQVMQAVFATLTTVMQAALLVAFMPVVLFASLLGEVSVSVGSYPLLEIFIELPDPPQIDVTVG